MSLDSVGELLVSCYHCTMSITTSLHASIEDVALATLISLQASARALYAAANVGYAASEVPQKTKMASGALRRGWMKLAYEEVMDLLPDDSPFLHPLSDFMRADIASIKAQTHPDHRK